MHDSTDGEGTPTWKEVVEPRLERRPRATQEAKAEDAYMDVGGRTAPGASSRAITERKLFPAIANALTLINFVKHKGWF